MSGQSAENHTPERVCPICHRTARVDIEPGQFGMESVTFQGHYVSDERYSSVCRSFGVKHVQPTPVPPVVGPYTRTRQNTRVDLQHHPVYVLF